VTDGGAAAALRLPENAPHAAPMAAPSASRRDVRLIGNMEKTSLLRTMNQG
jgi:hypothetical protein